MTEIYAIGGGYFTQVAPTEYRKVWRRKVLTAKETIEDFRDATAEEVRKYLDGDAAVEAPPQWLIDEAARQGVPFNERTGFFEYNGMTDLTAANVEAMLRAGRMTHLTGAGYFYYHGQGNELRTILQPQNRQHKQLDAVATFYNCDKAEVIPAAYLSPSSACFGSCLRLRRIVDTGESAGTIRMATGYDNVFSSCSQLEEADLVPVSGLIDLSDSPKFKLESLRKMIVNAVNTEPMTIKVHPDLYAKMTAEDVPVPGTDSLDWTDYRPNLLPASYCDLHSAEYRMANFYPSLVPKVGAQITLTLWGRMGENQTQFFVCTDGGLNSLCALRPEESGVASFRGTWPKSVSASGSKFVNVFNYPSGNGSEAYIEKIKLEFGSNPAPQWTMCSDEIDDPELRERTQWRELLFMAAARDITIATRES